MSQKTHRRKAENTEKKKQPLVYQRQNIYRDSDIMSKLHRASTRPYAYWIAFFIIAVILFAFTSTYVNEMK